MSAQEKPWWSLTRTRRQSLLFGALWLVVAIVQLSSVLLAVSVPWWHWALTALLVAP